MGGKRQTHTIAINTGGGDCPGLNAVIRAVVKRGELQLGWKIIGIEDSFDGLLGDEIKVRHLTRASIGGALTKGGTLLGSTNSGNPFSYGDRGNLAGLVKQRLDELGCEGLIALGGDGSMKICQQLVEETGLKVIGVPKTIDNDLLGTDETFGFNSAVEFAAQAIDRLHSTAESHDRIMVVEVMGRDAGFIALHAGIAGGADAILLPEIPFDLQAVADKILERKRLGRFFSIVVVAEGARAATEVGTLDGKNLRDRRLGRGVADALQDLTGITARETVLGYLLRGGIPSAYDRVLCTRMGNHAVDLVERGDWNRLVVLRNREMTSIPLAEATRGTKQVDLNGDLVASARGVGIVFGDENR
jgi:ATP-dependent phosphofructokinase / diphosphate-dependent phosphofructokinase